MFLSCITILGLLAASTGCNNSSSVKMANGAYWEIKGEKAGDGDVVYEMAPPALDAVENGINDKSYAGGEEYVKTQVKSGTLTAGMLDDRSENSNFLLALDDYDGFWKMDIDNQWNTLEKQDQTKLDVVFCLDSTGSMGDEMTYLQAEIVDIIDRVSNNNIDVRVSASVYRDEQDEYVFKGVGFTEDIQKAREFLKEQNAAGGGDYPEAIDTALSEVLSKSDWRGNSVKVIVLVLDAPPHESMLISERMQGVFDIVTGNGVRVVPVVSSGADVDVEMLMRQLAYVTYGRYVFLTDDSGVSSGEHILPTDTDYDTYKLNDLLAGILEDFCGFGFNAEIISNLSV